MTTGRINQVTLLSVINQSSGKATPRKATYSARSRPITHTVGRSRRREEFLTEAKLCSRANPATLWFSRHFSLRTTIVQSNSDNTECATRLSEGARLMQATHTHPQARTEERGWAGGLANELGDMSTHRVTIQTLLPTTEYRDLTPMNHCSEQMA